MAPNDHVAPNPHYLPPQSAFPNAVANNYDHLFSRGNQYNASAAWDPYNQAQSGLQSHAQSPNPPSWHHPSPALSQQQYNAALRNGAAQQPYQTASPYQYARYDSTPPAHTFARQPAVDPALTQHPTPAQAQQSPYQQQLQTATPPAQSTVSPQVLQQNAVPQQHARPASQYQVPKSTADIFAQRAASTPLALRPVSNPKYDIPAGKVIGGLYVIDQNALAKATNSVPLNKFVNIGTEPLHLATNRTILPTYTSRQSLKVIKKAGAGRAKFKDRTSHRPSHLKLALKPGTTKVGAGSPSALQREVSDSESYTDSDDDSEYTSDEDEESPLPATRPDDPHQAVRYDVIKASWFPRAYPVSSDKIKRSLSELWEVLNTIQKRWRADSKAVAEAEEKKKTGELPVLKSRVSSQRDLLHSALNSALEFTHPDVLYHLGQVKPFIYLCYQFLANRFKMQDYDGQLPTVIYKVLAQAGGTLTTEILEETKLNRALNSMKKVSSEANKALIQQIVEAAAAGSKRGKTSSPPQSDAVEPKGTKRQLSEPAFAGRPTTDNPAAKKLKPSDTASAVPKKLGAGDANNKQPSTAIAAPQKRPGEKPAAAPAKARVTQAPGKPSSFFSTLNAAATKKPAPTSSSAPTSKPTSQPKAAGVAVVKEKKPGAAPAKPSFSFAETMAQLLEPKKEPTVEAKPEKKLPPETPEEKAKRLRKEARRHLRVTFRPDASLVDIRYFSHDPEEEQGHDENFVRDAGDIGGEGRMFKQHRDMMDEDEDEDETEVTLMEWRQPSSIDFSAVPAEERARNFEPLGGGEQKPVCPEKEANQRRESSVLIVNYIDKADIPPSPKEPPETPPAPVVPAKDFGAPTDARYLERAPKLPAPQPDLSFLEKVFSQHAGNANGQQQQQQQQQQHQQHQQQPPQLPLAPTFPVPQPVTATPASTGTANLAEILSKLNTGTNVSTTTAVPPSIDANALSALYSTMQQYGAQLGGASLPPLPPGWPTYGQNLAPQPPPQPESNFGYQQQGSYNQSANGASKRQRDDGHYHGNERGHGSFKKQKNGRNHAYTGEKPHKVIACKFYPLGTCTKGDDCTFIHDV
ncbi:uncharacterized protein EI97DRAFT_325221 [Westerdykella ornata]|uniref:C3H1-type domain-containing protein n=1 Tax=Westerdykella ornata TaxID=318751 RepID=A0A6A6JPN4_WESOR|nr:uncharacterized protein EI97DRAFT_325221 [Westerdykella ornata]KAF2276919.1 hypothetical protein EI97DRAFT_325221 [Westerdykella ornata]